MTCQPFVLSGRMEAPWAWLTCLGSETGHLPIEPWERIILAESTAVQHPLTVSVLVPCWNESATILGLLEAIGSQTHPLERIEVLVVDGGSEDGTRDLVRKFQQERSDLRVILLDNPRRIIPAALNIGILAATGDVLLRLDGHSKPAPDYVERCVALLESGKGDMVGGRLDVRPRDASWQALSVACAVSHPFGVGDAHFRFSDQEREVDTIAFCAFRRSWIERVGLYDETLLTNEDYEFNARIRKAGGRIWLDPSLRTVYYPPATLGGLYRQYRRYGFWKGRMLQDNLSTLRWRHSFPPLAVWGGLVLAGLATVFPLALGILLALVAVYLTISVSLGVAAGRRSGRPVLALTLPVAFLIAHVAWGFFLVPGFVVGREAN